MGNQLTFGLEAPERKRNRYFIINDPVFGDLEEMPLIFAKEDWREIDYVKQIREQFPDEKMELIDRNVIMKRKFLPDVVLGKIVVLYDHQVKNNTDGTFRIKKRKE